MTPDSLKRALINARIQIVELSQDGTVISSDNTLIEIPSNMQIAEVHPFFLSLEHMIKELDDTLKFPCVNLEIAGVEKIVDIELSKHEATIFLILFDFTDHYKASQPLVQEKNESAILKNKLSFERNLLIAKEEFKNNFLAHLNHEIRNPLNNLMGFMEVLSGSKLSYDQKETLNVMQKTGLHLKVLMDDLIDISKIERGLTDVKNVNFNLGHILHNLQNHFNLKYAKSPVALEITSEKYLPTKLIGDPVRINQILFNLLENAFRHTTEGQINIAVSLKKKVGKDNKAFIHFLVSDTGAGVPKENLSQIFDSYFQLELDKIKPIGSGLGLKIVKDLTTLLNGSIRVESEPKKGTTFEITIPFQVREARKKRKSVPKGSGIMMGKRILIVENEEINQMLFMKFFINNDKGFQIEIANEANHAIDLLSKKNYDVIILKKTLVDMDGFEFIRKLRSDSDTSTSNIPIIMASGSTMIDEQEKSLSAGATAFLPKPYSKKELFATIDKVMKK